ncbi:MAG: glycosyltransferase [Acetatifactor sp.]|nr:glycosyltransferase [Acetatifactor sp.]
MRRPMFSILMVSLNPGDKLVETMRSVAKQIYTDYEVIVKDGGSKDGSLDELRSYLHGQELAKRVRILEQPDTCLLHI